ncbi:OmpA family protein, partial [Candidatus Latescibacterota bacterium]
TYGKGAFVVGVKSLVMKKESTLSGESIREVNYPAVLGIPISFGLTDEVDFTASFYGFNDARIFKDTNNITLGYGDPEGGVGASRLGVKIRLPLSMESRLQVAGKFGALLNTSAAQIDGMNYRWSRTGTDIETSLYQTLDINSFLSLNFEQGYVISGSDIYDDQIVGAAGLQFHIKDRLTVNFEIINRTFLGVGPQSALNAGSDSDMYNTVNGMLGTGNPALLKDSKADYREDFFLFSPSFIIWLNDNTSMDIGVNINIADHVEPRETFQGVIGLTFKSELKSMVDSDRDGINNRIDIEPHTPAGFPVDNRGVALDTDKDGVPDGADKETDTLMGAKVNSFGIGRDSDSDGIYDGLDMEPETPKGCPVNKYGVAYDDDKDGVPNGLDMELDTPVGALVNINGISLDDDDDGVPNGLDIEPETPVGAVVNRYGVSIDSDRDGVPDGIDMEPDTPEGVLVDRSGRALVRQEYSLLVEGLIRLNTINFAIGSSKIDVESYGVLNEIGSLLIKYPTLKIQIGGHTDSVGDEANNFKLSRDRALSVREYILTHFPEINKESLRAVGFGSEKPFTSNATPEGRKQNRRVEFAVVNQEELFNISPNP